MRSFSINHFNFFQLTPRWLIWILKTKHSPQSSDSSSACFKISTTFDIVGRSLAVLLRHKLAKLATLRAAARLYWFLSRGSIIILKLLLFAGNCFTHSSSFCSPVGRFLSRTRLPVMISYSTTPKLHMSLCSVRCPVTTYSGAAYPYVPTTCDCANSRNQLYKVVNLQNWCFFS